ncbi:deoxyribodipyrimidine photo-lyase [Permianibacter aggregans]|uniref:Deoxyribodipyrimidine photo-lyase n=1 Tax=Permianibacter aggregans TaxID=1510150 RepID=A0A4R6UQ98_9GAMM|nr:deoxyribodipyrimidine photo-lyase [Permianibacter aggregans]QGX39118.1 deoxyribodipyrimidine photo-lyase [Permianibacter aggregans]TDQ47673.1 deoxyribodipyrimidine photo-lyase type I [Permianibacter aggregans]
MHLVWFRSDLRVHDNSALHAACSAGGVVQAVFVLSERQLDEHVWAGRKRAFARHHVQALADALAERGIALAVLHSDKVVGQWRAVLDYARKQKLKDIWFNDEYGVHEQDRDQALIKAAEKADISVRHFADRVLLPPGSVLTKQDTPYTVYTPFRHACEPRLNQISTLSAPRAATKAIKATTIEPFPGEQDYDQERWPTGEKAALKKLHQFVRDDIAQYHELRDRPDVPATSELGPYLSLGVLSPRQVWQAAQQKGDGAKTWRNEILWREFYLHLMAQLPELSKHQPFKSETDQLPWRHDKKAFKRWCEGKTGVPIVDAAMRCLNETGWMHNRLRMIVASFLTKNLFIDWRWGERYFLQQLIDGDFAANNGGWQWSASTGTDAAPYFRIFNPVTQGERFDPHGDFVRRWLPELQQESSDTIHQTGARGDYPEAMVDLKTSRAQAIEWFKGLKK